MLIYSEIINWLLVWMQQGGSNFYNEFGRILLQIKNSPEKSNNEVDYWKSYFGWFLSYIITKR